ncbi:MAG: type VI secretion system protein TssA [Methylococcales bacterium]|nr:type VI secretion system protein TssA [Methylococcales bacterium]MDD5630726.1 type VI secretion system protein TssA [Methylococcales bacterium]
MSDSALERYLKEIAPGSPCGENLEFDSAFADLEQEIKGTPERQIGDSIIPEKEPDWNKIRDLAYSLLERSRDIQIIMHLTCALTHTDGFSGLDNGLTLIRELLQKHWDDVYPRQDPEDDYPILRINTLSTLNDYKKILDPLINFPLTNSKLGNFSWNQIETSKNNVDALSHMNQDSYLKKGFDKSSPDTLEEAKKKASDELATIEAAFKDTNLETLKYHEKTIKHAIEQAEGIVAITSDKAGSENAPDISRLITSLKNLQKLLDEKIKLKEALALEKSASETELLEEFAPVVGLTKEGGAVVKSSGMHTREDVISAIDVICKYFERYEPSSPVPFLMQRAKKLLTMNFMEILQDLTPEAVSQAEKICGVQKQNNT